MSELKEIAMDCRRAARFYERSPGAAGPGTNSQTIMDLYQTIERLAKALNYERGTKERKG